MRITALIIVLMLPLMLGTTYIVRESGKEVGKWSENDGKEVVQYIDNDSKREPDPAAARADRSVSGREPSHDDSKNVKESNNLKSMTKDELLKQGKVSETKSASLPVDPETDTSLRLREIYRAKKTDFPQKEQRAYDLLLENGEKIDDEYCQASRVMGETGSSESASRIRKNGKADFDFWKQDNFKTYSECYEMGEVFGSGNFKDVEEHFAGKIMTEEEFKDWLHAREVKDLKDQNQLLKMQMADAARSSNR
jgi:hypothetical protein